MSDMPMSKPSETDWERVDALTDADIDTSDIPPLNDTFFKRAKVRMPHRVVPLTMSVDADVLEWFKSQGDNYEARINAALRLYAEIYRVATHTSP